MKEKKINITKENVGRSILFAGDQKLMLNGDIDNHRVPFRDRIVKNFKRLSTDFKFRPVKMSISRDAVQSFRKPGSHSLSELHFFKTHHK